MAITLFFTMLVVTYVYLISVFSREKEKSQNECLF